MPTSYRVVFRKSAQKDWDKLDHAIRAQFSRKLEERRQAPRVLSARLHTLTDCYKIKLKAAGKRLIYRVYDDRIVILVLAVGARDGEEAYEKAERELAKLYD